MSKTIFDIEAGKVRSENSPVLLPKFSIHFYRTGYEFLDRFLIIGLLYRGYVGMMVIFYRFRFDLMIHHPDRELKQEMKGRQSDE